MTPRERLSVALSVACLLLLWPLTGVWYAPIMAIPGALLSWFIADRI